MIDYSSAAVPVCQMPLVILEIEMVCILVQDRLLVRVIRVQVNLPFESQIRPKIL